MIEVETEEPVETAEVESEEMAEVEMSEEAADSKKPEIGRAHV